ncbi:hypothetical protein CYLTODRAFT_402583 [Cylindrobasidium torrendii FP15055 ss-10]|uniref:RING-CH-type domain-containing protein n=1 Tax=Cylindrobasidium torrendii FP15055 ss-10 TaxID=1314674 RepID=A0A0D7B2X4_9AGAR|nr:hypothetical protein CYLTODRAFT_402583 [Cylindrobasidium torrendii FP15055 ss-10]
MSDYVPTIDDLRVKLCYICRDEEVYTEPTGAVWIHPCRCALIAHEACLLEWLQSAQTRSDAAAASAAKCPQCNTPYEITSDNPLVLRMMNWVSRQSGKIGTACLVGGAVAVAASVGVGMYATSMGYGVYAMKLFLGQEVFDAVLTDDTTHWPMMAYIQLPLIPFNFVFSRIAGYSPLIHPILAALSFTPTVRTFTGKLPYARRTELAWPPTPQLAAVLIIPFIHAFYHRTLEHLSTRLLGPPSPQDDRVWDHDRLWARDVFVDEDFRHGINVNGMDIVARGAHGNGLDDNGNVPARGAQPVPARPGAITIQLQAIAVFGRTLASALLVPLIASRFGALLLRIPFPSLRRFLGVRSGWRLGDRSFGTAAGGSLHGAGFASTVLQALWGGALVPWAQLDPVWWRNSVGYALYALGRDAFGLVYRYLEKREKETRKVRDLPFAEGLGVGE